LHFFFGYDGRKKGKVTVEFKMREAGFSANFEYGELHVAGNKEFGFRPYQLMVSSIAVYSGGVLRGILEKKD
jgi:uncharacterized OsmC-like protein